MTTSIPSRKRIRGVLTEDAQSRNLGILLIVAIVFHGALLPFSLEATYDAYIHMFFGDHYRRSWFDPWEPRWYTGFSVTSYPPATHMIMGLLQNFISLKLAYVVTMLLGIITLIMGFYRFVRIWLPEYAFLSALLLIFASSIAETIHIFGQLPTIFSLGIFLNAMPHVFRWLYDGDLKNLFAAILLSGAATSAHHVTTIFGSVFFIGSLSAYAWFSYLAEKRPFENGIKPKAIWIAGLPILRGVVLAVLMILVVIFTVFPYWYWSFTDPINQVAIPHGTRENFLERTDLGMVFFIIPWGVTLIFLPYIFIRGFASRLWPFAAAILLCFILGTGGTTPVPKLILRGAFDILTLDRFTFWGSILALPFVAMIIQRLEVGYLGRVLVARYGARARLAFVGVVVLGIAALSVTIGTLSAFKQLQPDPIDPTPIKQFMESDEHYRWRYLTLGFGDQFAYVSANSFALSVDGNYHSARRLPDLTNRSVERLENAKYLGVGGIGSLQQFLFNANEYHLKYIFSNDGFYDPLLYASGWDAIVRLPNNIVVWEKPNIDPLPFNIPRKNFPISHRLMWGIIPITMCLIGYIIIGFSAFRQLAFGQSGEVRAIPIRFRNLKRDLNILLFTSALMVALLLVQFFRVELAARQVSKEPDQIVAQYLKRLNLRHFERAYEMLDPKTREKFENFHFEQMWNGGLVNSFGELRDVKTREISSTNTWIDFEVETEWLTALGLRERLEEMRVIERDGQWYIVPQPLPAHQTPERIMSRIVPVFHSVGRRQPLPETDLLKDMPDRPNFAIRNPRLVNYNGRYAIIGVVNNLDVDPLNLSLKGELYDRKENPLIRSGGGLVTPFHLLPSETGGFRVEFQGRLSIQDAEKYDGFDPEIYVPPVYEATPERARIGASSVINGFGTYRNVMMNKINIQERDNGLLITGQFVNNGTKILTTAKIISTFYDNDEKVRWVEADFVDSVVRPGQAADFEIVIPNAAEIEVISEITPKDLDLNMNLDNQPQAVPDARLGTIPLNGKAGYSAMRIYIDPQVYEETF